MSDISGSLDIVVVDGSNIATEGRAKPSLSQLNDAVMAFMEEHPEATITVVVDATFGHRIESSEVKEFEIGVANNELVTPPAGAIGRGDAFVLSIADKVDARILSNDSFQEFHGQYDWLFDDGRLIGGKPVPHVGWVFVERLPVRGATSRRSERGVTTRRSGRTKKAAGPTTTAAQERAARTQAMAEGRLPPAPPGASGAPVEQPEPASRGRSRRNAPGTGSKSTETGRSRVRGGRQRGGDQTVALDGAGRQRVPEAVNDTLPFIEFVEKHPVGTSVNAVVESYSSHGAYVTVDDVRGYVPLHLIGDPPPRSARTVMAIGDALTLVVASYSPARRSIDLAFPAMVPATDEAPSDAAQEVAPTPARRRARKTSAAVADDAPATPVRSDAEEPASRQPAGRKRASKKSVAEAAAAEVADAKTSATPRATRKASKATKATTAKTAAKTPAAKTSAAKTSAAKTSAAKTSAAKKAAGGKSSPAATPAPTGKKTPATRRPGATQAPVVRRPTKEASTSTTPAKKAPAKRAAKMSAAAGEDAGRTRRPRRTGAASDAPDRR